MPGVKFASFSNTFLLDSKDGGEPTLKFVGPTDGLARKKRPHRKSRKGCVACKRRKVKCDEKQPCGNCIKRKESCTHPRPAPRSDEDDDELPRRSPTDSHRLSRELSPIIPADEANTPVNLLHLELFHHFAHATRRTLCFEEVWPLMLPLAVHHDYLMNAMLSIAAAHMSSISPCDDRYRCASLSSLSQSVENFRHQLSLPITTENSDALMGTSILIHYMSWRNLDVLDDQTVSLDSPESSSHVPLDLSCDQLFLLSSGMRQIYMMSHPHFHSPQSIFSISTIFRPCNILDDILVERGIDKSQTSNKFLALYNDPRFNPSPSSTTALTPDLTATSPNPSTPNTTTTGTDATSCFFSLAPWDFPAYASPAEIEPPLDPSISNCFTATLFPELPTPIIPGSCDPEIITDLAASYHLSTAFERVVGRLSAMLEYAKLLGTSDGNDGAGGNGFLVPQRTDLERYVLSFPVTCFGPFLPLVLGSDARALVVLWYFYRVARVLLMLDDEDVVMGDVEGSGSDEEESDADWEGRRSSRGRGWWCGRRCVVMEQVIGAELKARGLDPVALLEGYCTDKGTQPGWSANWL